MESFPRILSNYSSSVDMHLEAGGGVWPLAKTACDHFVPASGFDLPACDGVIVVNVDGKEHRSIVRLVNGARLHDMRIAIRRGGIG